MINRVIVRFSAVLAPLTLLAACASEGPPCAPCGTAVVAVGADVTALLPPAVNNQQSEWASDLMFLKLADIGLELNTVGDVGFQPRLARSWKVEDSVTIAFEIDPRARWHDGTPVTAQDVAFTFKIYRDSRVGHNARALLGLIREVTARDDRTAVFRFSRFYPEQFYDATYHMRVVPRHLLDTIPTSRLTSHAMVRAPTGNGPYRLVDWKAGASLQFASDTTFFLGRPGIHNVIFSITSDVNTARALIVSGQADMQDYIGTGPDVAAVEALPDYRVLTRPQAGYAYVVFNFNDRRARRPHPILADREVRRAIIQGIDLPALNTRVLGAYGLAPVGPISRLTPIGTDSTIPKIGFDSIAAGAALEKAGWKDTDGDGVRDRNGRPLEIELVYPSSSVNRVRSAEVIRENLARIGVRVVLNGMEFNLMNDGKVETRDFDAALLSWGDDPSPSGIRQIWTTAAHGEANYGRYSNPQFDALVDQAIATADPAAARAQWREAYAMINNDAPAIWLYTVLQPTAIHRRFENVTLPGQQWLSTLWTWRVPADKMIPRDRLVSAPASP